MTHTEAARALKNAYNREYHRKKGAAAQERYWKKKLTEMKQQLAEQGYTELVDTLETAEGEALNAALEEAIDLLAGTGKAL